MAAEPTRACAKEECEMREMELRLFVLAAQQALEPYGGIETLQLSEVNWRQIADEIQQCSTMVPSGEDPELSFYQGILVQTPEGFPSDRITATMGDWRIDWATNGQLFDQLTDELVKAITNSLRCITPLEFAQGGPVHSHKARKAFDPGSYLISEVILPRSKAYTHIPAAPVRPSNEPPTTLTVQFPRPEEG